MRVETVTPHGSDRWTLGLVGTQTEQFRRVTLTVADLQAPNIPARLKWNEVTKVAHYYLSVDAVTQPMQVRERPSTYE